jgi:hypothetical protein
MKVEQSVPKRQHIQFRRQGITQKKIYNIRQDMLSAAITKCYQEPPVGTKFLIISNSVTVHFAVRAHMRGSYFCF